MSRHDNAVAIEAAVDRWIEEAQSHAAGVFHLRRRASWLDDQLAKLAAAVDRDMLPPLHLEGLTVSDIHSAKARLLVAARDLEGA
jgi:hypothetical protein